jgi:hypothetical protein
MAEARKTLNYTAAEIDERLAAVSNKVDKVEGMGLSETNFTAEEKQKLNSLENYDDSAVTAELSALSSAGAKNLICNTASSRTEAGVTFTVEPDGSVSLNGTAANTIWFPIMTNMSIAAGTYTISNGLADDTVRVIISPTNAVNQRVFDSNENGYITRTIEAVSGVNAYLRIASGKITDGVTVKPMLRDAAISDGTYQPYAPTNRELYEMILALRSGSSVQSLTPSAQLTATEPTEEDR